MASADTIINATGAGWCTAGICNNTNVGVIANTYAGTDNSGTAYRDWFYFSLPNVTVTSATLSIWSAPQNFTSDPNNTYELHTAQFPNYGNLFSGGPVVAGPVAVGAIDTGVGHYETFTMNADGIFLLNFSAGNAILYGGGLTTDPGVLTQLFGYTTGFPVAFLTLETSAVPGPVVGAGLPSLVMAFGGFLAWRRRKAVAA
jgi:hypothetical protein